MSDKEGMVLSFSDLVQLVRKEYDREEMGYADAAQIVDRAIEGHIRDAALRAQLDAYFQLTGIARVYSHEGLVSYINSQFDDLQAELAAPTTSPQQPKPLEEN